MSTSSSETLISRIVAGSAKVFARFSSSERDSRLWGGKGRRVTVSSAGGTAYKAGDLPPCQPLSKAERSEKDQLALMRNALYEND